jgi:hypothetical protein
MGEGFYDEVTFNTISTDTETTDFTLFDQISYGSTIKMSKRDDGYFAQIPTREMMITHRR